MADKTDTEATKAVKIGLAAGMIGAAAGAAGVLLSDKENREKVSEKLDQVKKWSDKTVADWKTKMDATEQDAEKSIDDVKEDISTSAKEALDETDTPKSFSSKQIN